VRSAASLQEALALIASQLDVLGFTDLSARRLNVEIGRYISELHLLGVSSLRDATAEHALEFIRGAVRGRHGRDKWYEPTTATETLRRTALRTCYLVARNLGLAENDPTIDIRLPPRSGLSTEPAQR
jgi:hypothetical protein